LRKVLVSRPTPLIHLLNPMWNAFGGSEQRALRLYEVLRQRAQVFLWSEQGPDPRLSARVPVRRITEAQHPVGGTLVVVGCYFDIGVWLPSAYPDRVIQVVNTTGDNMHAASLDLLSRTGRTVELVFASEATQKHMGVPGRVEPSPLDLQRFTPSMEPRDPSRFVVGRLSRNDPRKHHPEDPALYAELARAGCSVVIMGGTTLADGGFGEAVQLLPAGAVPAERFLQGLDCFVYRTSPQWFETYGRVVSEAMACGLAVVVHRRGGHAEGVRHGETGFLFDSTGEALEHILRLRDDPALRARIGAAAREAVTRRYSDEYWAELTAYYLGGA
jgi:glycosyltransferase involved in cell wall biosynthesis